VTRATRGRAIAVATLAAASTPAFAASALDGGTLSLAWGIPFVGVLLSLAVWPMFAADFWHHHYGKITAVWTAAFLLPFAAVFGAAEAGYQLVHVLLLEYLPFVILLFSLYTIAGGIAVRGTLVGTPGTNCALLLIGALLASVMGTTGATMVLIRPLLAANEGRRHRVHVVVFFIILVGNIGGALTPLGDPPLFIGFLKGVRFFWTAEELALPTLALAAALLGLFAVVDTFLRRGDPVQVPAVRAPLRLDGSFNVLLIIGVVAAVLLSGLWKPGIVVNIAGTPLELQNALRDIALVALALASLKWTPRSLREANAFNWEPIVEVAKLFAGIFITIIPVIVSLQAGQRGALAAVVQMVVEPNGEPRYLMYFWVTGLLSAFLDNAPTYLVFFNLAGGDAETLMGLHARTLAMISAGAVYFGALTYVGNAPNFMVKAIAESRGVPMPTFFVYFAIASVILLPMFVLLSLAYR
jgi:Na+/H+ antiporter NhaD/arsenite permease-like protein